MKKIICFTAVLMAAGFFNFLAAETKASEVAKKAAEKATVEESITYIKNQVNALEDLSEKRSTYIFLASLQEQLSLFDDAQQSYVAAAAISAVDAEDMIKKSNQQLVLDAVRCSLSVGDWQTADSYLNSSVRNSKNEKIQAYIKLYSQWSILTRAENAEDLQEPVLMLQAYSKLDNMKVVRPAILLTLWYVTGDKAYSDQLTQQFPVSVETAIVNGDIQLLPTPFWFFVPKSGEAVQGTGSFESMPVTTANPEPVKVQENKTAKTKLKYQLGLFRTESNAKALSNEVNLKGFNTYVTSEKRSSGTTYYLVLVDDDEKGNLADRLRSIGYECYAVE